MMGATRGPQDGHSIHPCEHRQLSRRQSRRPSARLQKDGKRGLNRSAKGALNAGKFKIAQRVIFKFPNGRLLVAGMYMDCSVCPVRSLTTQSPDPTDKYSKGAACVSLKTAAVNLPPMQAPVSRFNRLVRRSGPDKVGLCPCTISFGCLCRNFRNSCLIHRRSYGSCRSSGTPGRTPAWQKKRYSSSNERGKVSSHLACASNKGS
jgi:hypothetical protein